MNGDKAIEAIGRIFRDVLQKDHDIENVSVTIGSGGWTCIRVKTEQTILRLGTFAARVQSILDQYNAERESEAK